MYTTNRKTKFLNLADLYITAYKIKNVGKYYILQIHLENAYDYSFIKISKILSFFIFCTIPSN